MKKVFNVRGKTQLVTKSRLLIVVTQIGREYQLATI